MYSNDFYTLNQQYSPILTSNDQKRIMREVFVFLKRKKQILRNICFILE